MTSASRLVLILTSAASLAFGQISIRELKVEGNQRLPAAGIIAASGLRLNTTISEDDLRSAMQTLLSTGLFSGGSYKYGPSGTGSVVTLSVVEEKAASKVILDIPGLDEAAFWSAMAGTLVDRTMPTNQDAATYYSKSIQDYLARLNRPEEIRESDETDLATHSMTAVFQPAHRAMVAGIRFTGNHAIAEKTLEDLTSRLIVDNSYSERDERTVLEENLRPAYEEKGYLKVAFPTLTPEKKPDGKVIVTVTVEEGRVWNLGVVTPGGEGVDPAALLKAANLKTGRVANGKEIAEGVERMLNEFRKTGFIGAKASTTRMFHEDTGAVDLNIKISRGRPFRFGSLEITGLSDGDKRKAEGMWKLRAGAPMDLPYVDEYLKAVFQDVRPPQTSVRQQLKVNGDSVLIAIEFTGGK